MAWSLAVLVAVVAAAWILILAVARSSTAPCILGSNGDVRIRRSSSRRRRSLPASVEDVDISDDLISGSDLQDRLRGQLGWFWLAVSYHFSTSEKSRGNNPNYFKNRSRKSMSLLLSKYVNVYYTLGTLCVLAFFFGIPVYLILEVHRNLSSSGSLPKSGTDLDSDIISPSGLMIPGLTVPLRDWLSLFLASFMAIAWHEAGHAIVAILYVNSLFTFNAFQLGNESHVDITSFAFILIFVFPGGYVALDNTSIEALPSTSSKLRIISAGVWHNITLCIFISMGMQTGLLGRSSTIYRYLGYTDMNELGVVVQLVDKASPLSGLLEPQMLITHLDDVEMHDSYVYRHWDNYLLSSSSTQGRNYDSLGFCIDETLYALRPEDCCEANYSSRSTEHAIHGSRQVCYQTSGQDLTDNRRKKEGGGDTSIGHCFDPGELLGHPRCTDTCHEENQTCIYPASSANLLRITARNTFNGVEEVILYRGQKNQLWNDIKIGRYLASHKSIQSLPLDIETFWLYTSSISFSLALFNLLPLPRLDGAEILDSLLYDSPTTLAPVLPLVARDTKTYHPLYGQGNETRLPGLDRILHSAVTTLQGFLLGGNDRLNTNSRGSRGKYWRDGIRYLVGSLACLNLLCNVYSQLCA